MWGGKDGERFRAEIAGSNAAVTARDVFVMAACDVQRRRRESEGHERRERRALACWFDHAPEGDRGYGPDTGSFVDRRKRPTRSSYWVDRERRCR